ncbi:RNA polymerase subunit sigma-70 [Dactylosporangium aurantiacum]|uniref:RNA polymerase subunit sigma-70 n=2 Tax=Dactylosporangium aurantiacum TaxID=35754 RepID=A0A9Q9I6W8_9ACTN|nr:sigma factor-like helix-turn-helix DNA-binding protein [Dactylosporangium aurantiacum]MDG6106613.1 sigma factor [Dactylosporangium aurantiacum]UWZ50774.1 RNA polymerase subunit sigma-70 [Dactylosporangium aurantiacum]
MNDHEMLAQHFQTHRAHLRAVALRILGSADAAEEALHETQLRITHGDGGTAGNVPAWLTNVVTRVCLDTLRARHAATAALTGAGPWPEPWREPSGTVPPAGWREASAQLWDERWDDIREELRADLPDDLAAALPADLPGDPPVELPADLRDGARAAAGGPMAAIAESATLAMLVTLDRLAPAERLAFVLHDLLAVPFEEVAAAIGRTPAQARRLAERARRTVRRGEPAPGEHSRRSQAIQAFLGAARTAGFGDVLDPQVVLRSDRAVAAAGVSTIRGAVEVAGALAGPARSARPALIDGAPGAVWVADGRPTMAFLFTVVGSRIVDIELVADPQRLAAMHVELTDEPDPSR